MSKLIRLIGDSSVKNNEIKNFLPRDLKILSGSKIRCISANANILSESDLEEFPVGEEEKYSYRPNVTGSTSLEVVIPQAIYPGIRSLLNAMQIAANSVGIDENAWRGIHNRWLYEDGKCKLEIYQAALGDADWEDTDDWNVINGDAALTKTSSSIVSDGTEQISIYAGSIIPLSYCVFKATVSVVSQFSWNVVEERDATDFVFGMDLNTSNPGQYSLNFLDVNGNPDNKTDPYAPSPGDKFEFTKIGNTIRLVVVDALNNPRVDKSQELFPASLVPQSLMYDIEIDSGSTVELTLCQCNYITQIQPALLSATSHTEIRMALNSEKLRQYLGYDELVYKFDGDPAVLEAYGPPRGFSKYPGIMIEIRELKLDCYSGAVSYRSANSSFLGVTNLTDNFTTLQYEPPVPVFLTITENTNVSSLTVSFVQDNISQKHIEFYGHPVILLEIHDPPED